MKKIKKILITSTTFAKTTKDAIKKLEDNDFEIQWEKGPFTDLELSKLVKDFDVIIIGNDIVGEECLNKGEKLKIIVKHGVGIDNINKELANKKGIKIINAPHTNAITVAEFVFASLLTLIRKTCKASQSLLEGKWEGSKFIGEELYGKTMGIIGIGHIGQHVAHISIGFGMKVFYYDVIKNEDIETKFGIYYLNFENLIKISDFITIHIPQSKNTINMINKKEIDLMKPSAYLINMSRGLIVNEEALYEALKNKRIKGAILDVFSKEPVDKNWKMLKLDNILCTPHCAGYTLEALNRTSNAVVNEIIKLNI
ncbi:MAG: hypothetical protein Kow00103_01360 [Candidatus Caldatribacteriota bacterium]